jgi:hypothetical protein
MEVHAHTHTARKKWTHYFWEFLMLFLAVFCGFLAEYQLEHKIEKDRAKELAKSFYDELENDSVTVGVKIKNRLKQEKALRDLVQYFNDSSLDNPSKKFELDFLYGVSFRTPSMFEPRTVVLEQLKNSGSLRYFKNEELQKLIGDLMVAINNIKDRQELETSVRMQYVNPLIVAHHDFDFEMQIRQNGKLDVFSAAEAYEKSNEMFPFHFKGKDKLDKEKIINTLSFYGMSAVGATRLIHYQKYTELNAQLLAAMREEYHLE